jgi:protein-S-isoprenylcysteine O-methyltransferase Ste14
MTPLDATRYVWLAWAITWFAAAVWSARTVKRPAIGREVAYRVITAAGAVLVFGMSPVRRHDIAFWRLDGVAGWLLAAVALGGALFMWWARITLGRFWSASVTQKAGHHVIDRGPYAIVRHPIYTGLIFGIAATVCIRASAQTLMGATLMGIGIYIKARLEEDFLRAELGPPYDAYAQRVPMLIPLNGLSLRISSR